MTAVTPKPKVEIKMDPKPTLEMRVADKIRNEIKALEKEATFWRTIADTSKRHNESEETISESYAQADFFVLNAKALQVALKALTGPPAKE